MIDPAEGTVDGTTAIGTRRWRSSIGHFSPSRVKVEGKGSGKPSNLVGLTAYFRTTLGGTEAYKNIAACVTYLPNLDGSICRA
jgi:hypothetical protein